MRAANHGKMHRAVGWLTPVLGSWEQEVRAYRRAVDRTKDVWSDGT